MKMNNNQGETMNVNEKEHLPKSEEAEIIAILDSMDCLVKDEKKDEKVKQGE